MQMNILTKNPTLSCLPIENFTLKGHTVDRLSDRKTATKPDVLHIALCFILNFRFDQVF